MRHSRSVGEYLAFLSLKYDLDPEEFLSALRQVESGKQINMGNVAIECRGRVETKQIFTIRNQAGVVAQFRVPDEFLLTTGNLLEYMNTKMALKYLSDKRRATNLCLIKDVRSGMTHINLRARILSIAEPKRVLTRYGNHAEVAKALIGDETGSIKVCLWNEQINAVAVGGTVHIGNARASVFMGERQLTVGPKGVIDSAENIQPTSPPRLPVTVKA